MSWLQKEVPEVDVLFFFVLTIYSKMDVFFKQILKGDEKEFLFTNK